MVSVGSQGTSLQKQLSSQVLRPDNVALANESVKVSIEAHFCTHVLLVTKTFEIFGILIVWFHRIPKVVVDPEGLPKHQGPHISGEKQSKDPDFRKWRSDVYS